MKKFLFVLLSLAVVGAAFAADAPAPALVLSGAVKTGVVFATGDNFEDGIVTLWSDDAGVDSRLELVGTYTNGDFGVKFRLRDDNFTKTTTSLKSETDADLDEDYLTASTTIVNAPYFSYGYAFGSLLNKKVTFKVGNIDDGAWAAQGDDGFDVADGRGLLINVLPIAGVNFGVKFDVTKTNTTEQFIGETALGGAYKTDLFEVRGGYKMDSDVDDSATADVDADAYSYAFGSFKYTGIKILSAVAEAKFVNLGAYSDVGYTWIDETFEYSGIDKVAVGVIMHQELEANSDKDSLFDFLPYVNYTLNDKTTLNASVFYGVQGDLSSIYVKPGVTYQLGPKAKFVGFMQYEMNDGGFKDREGYSYAIDGTDTYIQLDFIYSF